MLSEQIQTPAGSLLLAATDEGLCLSNWTADPRCGANERAATLLFGSDPAGDVAAGHLRHAAVAIADFFSGKTLEVDFRDIIIYGSPLRQRILRRVMLIPPGITASYSRIGAEVDPSAHARAVARAMATNPLQLIVPCHRVVGAGGSLCGYAGGLDAKKMILELESVALFRLMP